ncbi:MAG: hypothetical protein R6X20_11110 [Phycisphaerae bacterium]
MGPPTQPDAGSRRDAPGPARLLVVGLAALGLLARLAPGLMMTPAQAARLPHAAAYLHLARSLAEGHGFVLTETPQDNAAGAARDTKTAAGIAYHARRMPAYPSLIAAGKTVLGAPSRTTLIVQALAGTASLVLAAWMAYRLAGMWAAVVAAALLAFDPYQVVLASLFAPVALTGLALSATAAAGVAYLGAVRTDRRAWPWAAAGGLALAAAVYLEVWTLALAPVALVAAAVGRRRRRRLAGWAVGAAVLAAALVPWLVRNADRVGVPVLSTDVGRRLWAGTRPVPGETAPDPGGAGTEAAAPAPPEGRDEVGRGVFYLKAAGARIASAPGRWLGLAAGRVGRLWSPAPPEGLEDGPLGPAAGYTSLLPTALLALAGLGLLRRRGETWWLLLVPVTATLVHVALAGWAGDRAAVMPPLAAVGGAGLAALFGRPEETQDEEREASLSS